MSRLTSDNVVVIGCGSFIRCRQVGRLVSEPHQIPWLPVASVRFASVVGPGGILPHHCSEAERILGCKAGGHMHVFLHEMIDSHVDPVPGDRRPAGPLLESTTEPLNACLSPAEKAA
jgi:hypothetical protein